MIQPYAGTRHRLARDTDLTRILAIERAGFGEWGMDANYLGPAPAGALRTVWWRGLNAMSYGIASTARRMPAWSRLRCF